MRRVWVALALAASEASADDATSITVRTPERWNTDEPLLHVEYNLSPTSEGLGADVDQEAHIVDVGKYVHVTTITKWWQSATTPDLPPGHDLDIDARGWQMGGQVAYDVGPFQIIGSGMFNRVDGRYEHGSYRDVGIALVKRFRLSRWMHAWISLGIGQRQWYGNPPPGEANATTFMLTLGTTFR